MKKTKVWKITGLLMITAAVFTAISGCRRMDPDTEIQRKTTEEQYTVAWWGNKVRNDRTLQALDQYQESGVTVKGSSYLWEDYWNEMAALAAGRKLPDIIQMDMSYLKLYVQKEQLLDLSPYIENGMIDTTYIADDIIQMGQVEDGIYGIPTGMSAQCLFYNKTLLDEYDISISDHMTLDEFIALAREVFEKTGYRANLFHYGLYMEPYARVNGIENGEIFGGTSAEDYVPYFELLKQGVEEGWQITPYQANDTDGVEDDPMVYGTGPENMAWCTINGSAMLTAYQSAAGSKTDIALTTIPTTDPKKSNYVKPAMYFSVSADVKDPDGVIKLFDYLFNSEDAAQILVAERGIPVSSKISETILPLLSEQEQENVMFVEQVVLPNCSPMPPLPSESGNDIQELLRKLEEKVKYGEYTPQEAAEAYFSGANEMYQ